MTEKAKNRLPVAIVILLALFVVFWNRPSKLGSEFEPLGSETGTAGLPRRVHHVPTGIRLVLIEPGAFTMGTPETEPERDKDEIEHEITITEPFYLAETEVTVGLWRSLMGEEPWVEWDASDMPMTGVSWHRAKELVNTLNASGEGGWRLPTEAEWEYACRAGTTTVFSFGDDITTDQANFVGLYPYAGAPKGENREAPVPVASLPPNPWGLYEMHGNVWEWCEDLYSYDPREVKHASEEGASRVMRGGSFESQAHKLRSGHRDGYPPNSSGPKYGMRLAKSLP